MKRWFFFIFLGVFSGACFSQGFDVKIVPAVIDLETDNFDGYQTSFDFNADRVEKGLWKFSHSFAKTTNLRTHYEISIPVTNSNKSVLLIAQLERIDGQRCLLRMGVRGEVPETYTTALKDFMRQFKKYFYVDHYQQEIELLEAKAAGEAQNYLKSLDRPGANANEHMKTLQDIEQEIEALRELQRKVAI